MCAADATGTVERQFIEGAQASIRAGFLRRLRKLGLALARHWNRPVAAKDR